MEVIDVLQERLRDLMREKRIKAAPLARRASLNESAVRDILRGRSRNPGIVTLQRLAAVLEVPTSALFESGEVWPVVGRLLDDGVVAALEASAAGDVESPLARPFPLAHQAVLVNTTEARPFAEPGDHLIAPLALTPVGGRDDPLGRPCLCEFESGLRVVGVPMLAGGADALHLAPLNHLGRSRRDAPVRALAAIALVAPAGLARSVPAPTHAGSTALHEDGRPFEPPA